MTRIQPSWREERKRETRVASHNDRYRLGWERGFGAEKTTAIRRASSLNSPRLYSLVRIRLGQPGVTLRWAGSQINRIYHTKIQPITVHKDKIQLKCWYLGESRWNRWEWRWEDWWDTPRTRAGSPGIQPQHLPPSMIKLLTMRIKVGGLVGYSSYQGREPRNSATTPPS